jgi:hypothetical protein
LFLRSFPFLSLSLSLSLSFLPSSFPLVFLFYRPSCPSIRPTGNDSGGGSTSNSRCYQPKEKPASAYGSGSDGGNISPPLSLLFLFPHARVVIVVQHAAAVAEIDSGTTA